jgi:hypothetical protein
MKQIEISVKVNAARHNEKIFKIKFQRIFLKFFF